MPFGLGGKGEAMPAWALNGFDETNALYEARRCS
jgi:hypothetical protein